MNDTRERLLQVAIKLIWENSYSTVSVDAICKQAGGVNKGSFYHFFSSKCDLVLEALDMTWQLQKQKTFDPIFRSSTTSALEKFDLLFKKIYEFHYSSKQKTGHNLGCPFANLGSEAGILDDAIRNKVKEIFLGHCLYFESALRDAVREGLIRELDEAATAQSLWAYIEGVCIQAKVYNDVEMYRKLFPHAFKLIGIEATGKEKVKRT